jgi:hypothetical protein
VAFPDFIISPSLALVRWARALHQSRRKVKLTIHRADLARTHAFVGDDVIGSRTDSYFITVKNASRDRDIVVTHIWIETEPPVHIQDSALPVRLQYSAPWETSIPVKNVPDDPGKVPWLVRCQLSPDDKVVKSKPRENVPVFGNVPRG